MKPHIEILFEDEHLLLANKPSGYTVIPDRFGKYASLQKTLEKKYGKLFVVHRIDRETSGIVCFAKNDVAHRHLALQFQNHEVQKFYKVVVKGHLPFKEGVIESPIVENPAKPGTMMIAKRGKEAITICRVEEEFKQATLVSAKIKTGRTHQIRVHLSALGNPLLVDEIYANTPAFYFSSLKRNYKPSGEEERPTIARLTLHAYSLKLKHPITGNEMEFTAPLPKDLETLLKLLRKYDKK
ncbi:MAG: RluA family pseudouridine synthase [Chitinophagales bacterium]|nr:RluA family pseudouridine synthase [Chitinophagales bacterium]